MGLVGYTDASGVFHEAVSDAISTDADNALGHGTDGGLYVSASGGNANVKYYETDAQAEADYAAGNIPNDTSVIIRGTKPASDPELHKSDIATLAQIAGGTTTDGKVASAEDVYELNNSITDILNNLITVATVDKTVKASGILTFNYSFDKTYSKPPAVICEHGFATDASVYGLVNYGVTNITKTGCTITIYNAHSQPMYPKIIISIIGV